MKLVAFGAASVGVALCGLSAVAQAIPVSGQGTWETTLQGRDLDNNLATFEAYYDTVLDITWLADANYAGTGMDWTTANAWAAALDPYSSGITGWRLPITVDVGNDGATYTNIYQGVDYGYNITTHSELSHMFYETLGNVARYDTSGAETGCFAPVDYCLTNSGPFTNHRAGAYWSATEYAPDTAYAWLINSTTGIHGHAIKTPNLYAWAVHDGDIAASAVPVPAAAWLFLSGFLSLLGLARRAKVA